VSTLLNLKMNGMFTPEEVTLAIGIGEVCYGTSGNVPLPLAQIHAALAPAGPADIDTMLHRLNDRRLVRLAIGGNDVHPTIKGKEAYEINAIAELTFGEAYIAHKYRSAVVHIIVNNPANGQQSGATGFFITQPDNRIVTAKHTLEGRNIVRIEDAAGAPLPNVGLVQLCAGQMDLALIQCPTPAGVCPLRVEWREEATHELDRVLILGYPPFAGHQVGLFHALGQVNAKVLQLNEEKRYSLMISIAAPGCSGGPVISEIGSAVAVVSQENALHNEGAPPIAFISAVLSCYLRELT
jgi:hypothetical protein